MKELLDTLSTWQDEGIDAGRAVVIRTFGSAPRPEGAVLLHARDGRIAGSVSGHIPSTCARKSTAVDSTRSA